MRERRERHMRELGPDCMSESVVVASATDRLRARPGRVWRQVTSRYAREATIRGGGRTWTLTCSVRLEGVEGGRFLASVVLWSGDPETPVASEKITPAPRLLEFVAQTQRRVRAMGFNGRFHPELGDHWSGSFSRWFRGLEALDRTAASLDRLERTLGAVAKRADPTTECLAWGDLPPGATEHEDCPVVVTRARPEPLSAVCACDCLTCQRAWWDLDRPMQQGPRLVTFSGKVIRVAVSAHE